MNSGLELFDFDVDVVVSVPFVYDFDVRILVLHDFIFYVGVVAELAVISDFP